MPHCCRLTRLGVRLISVLLAVTVSNAAAQGTGRSMDIDGSAISSAMGGASTAVFWSAEPNYWANPALLGYYHGVRYQYARSQLVPGLAEDVSLTSHRITLAAYGLGLELAGKPVEGLGGTKLDYGSSARVDESGNVLGRFDSWEEIQTWGVGLSLSGLLCAVAPGSTVSALGRHFDIAGGFAQKHVEICLAPFAVGGRASGTTRDIGLLARGGFDFGAPGGTVAPLRLDLSFGAAVLNYNDVLFTFINEDQASPPSRMRRLGGAARFSIGLPAALSGTAGSPFAAAFRRGFGPVVSVGVAYDDEHVQAGSSSAGGYDVKHAGLEVAFFNVLAARFGHVTDRLGDIDGATWGLGLGLPVAGVAGVRYDYGRYPQATSLPQVTRHTGSIFVDPIALLRLRR